MWRDRPSLAADEARRLHAEALVIDTAHMATFSVPSERIRQARAEAVARRATRPQLGALVTGLALDELRTSPEARDAYLDLWRRSGVSMGMATTAAWEPSGEGGFESAVQSIANIYGLIEACAGAIDLIRTAADIERAYREKRPALGIMWQNSTPLGHKLERLDTFHRMGLRSLQLTYNLRNLAGDGCTERNAGGLSRFGIAMVERLNELRIAVDASHSSEKVGWDALEASRVPISLNHTAAKAVFAHDRAKGDDLIKAVASRGGFVGVVLIPGFIQGEAQASLDDFAAHVEHIARVAGIDAVGIGADMGGIYDITAEEAGGFERFYAPGFPWHGFTAAHRTFVRVLNGFRNVEDWPNLTVHLASRGFNEDELRKIIGLNYLRFFKDVVG